MSNIDPKEMLKNATTFNYYLSCRDTDKKEIIEKLVKGFRTLLEENFTWPGPDEFGSADCTALAFKVPVLIVWDHV